MRVQLFVPCSVDQMFPETAFNMVKVLEKLDCEVHYNTKQTCCGQPAFNGGFWGDAREVGEKFLKDFEGDDYIVAPSGSCTGFVRNYYTELFENTSFHNSYKQVQSNLFEFSEFLVDVLKVEDVGARLAGKATYHDGCASLRECNIKDAPRKLLQNVKGLELEEMSEAETCCGFGGTFSVKFEPISIGMADQKIVSALATQADYMISGDLSCLMHLDTYFKKQQKGDMKMMHIADVLAQGW